ncbi:retrovirus-related Pol polyprotein from transposon TNT 1-94 [Trichonephila inaurata madagascariensis]|uniref:Retrovirus-related Pol polyprotein from transposon TNT 1-94 n=1 Tax=Trichonephila inaurata madagascariensis TaxID=2747483 RepID=A0A8X6IDK6_9ARAC|nr:retrovirus-related Pol polyprotein from transposon TNT 1-94 [Trichonephila inaurata madagascariensis]
MVMNGLSENHTWGLTDLPVETKVIPCKWVYRLKTNPEGSINMYIARHVARVFSQRQGIDYSETYSPVAKLGTIRTVLSIAAEERMHLIQCNVSTAFLYRDLEETIYATTRKFQRWLRKNLGFKTSETDPSLYIQGRKGWKLLIVLYVNDGLIAATDQQNSKMFIKELKTRLKISVGEVSCFLGLEIEDHKDTSITINQKEYARKILKCFGFKERKLVATPMLKDCRLRKFETKIL